MAKTALDQVIELHRQLGKRIESLGLQLLQETVDGGEPGDAECAAESPAPTTSPRSYPYRSGLSFDQQMWLLDKVIELRKIEPNSDRCDWEKMAFTMAVDLLDTARPATMTIDPQNPTAAATKGCCSAEPCVSPETLEQLAAQLQEAQSQLDEVGRLRAIASKLRTQADAAKAKAATTADAPEVTEIFNVAAEVHALLKSAMDALDTLGLNAVTAVPESPYDRMVRGTHQRTTDS